MNKPSFRKYRPCIFAICSVACWPLSARPNHNDSTHFVSSRLVIVFTNSSLDDQEKICLWRNVNLPPFVRV
ncbi:uncharacterized protein F4807DRAFT_427416 [Annulohypoxylon truncatum]|uniref:uncharacterized protein n=1 Tax=Annulohypoxylon truncatum TaxID=327061 RepID=UPI002007DEDB|nr:uncharacterized protein F4807DRAFT_427416 [Annulohypoxylon truncatum]KAI1209166.1 hypothetical protein F4807DRAFT_427416 [Annulohypoxylon truncatum]